MKFQSLQSDTDEPYYSGEEEPNDGGKDVVVSVGNYTQALVLTNVIEDFLAKEGPAQLLGYVKASEIPKAKECVGQILGFID